jgi:hypothetical protein
MNKQPEESFLPRLLASNALRANLTKHMTLNQMADNKASMIMTAASLIITITITQAEKISVLTAAFLLITGLFAILFSIFAIIPPRHATGRTNLFYFRSFCQISEEEFILQSKQMLADKEELYDAYLHEIYYLGQHRLTRKYALIRNGLLSLLLGLTASAASIFFAKLI